MSMIVQPITGETRKAFKNREIKDAVLQALAEGLHKTRFYWIYEETSPILIKVWREENGKIGVDLATEEETKVADIRRQRSVRRPRRGLVSLSMR